MTTATASPTATAPLPALRPDHEAWALAQTVRDLAWRLAIRLLGPGRPADDTAKMAPDGRERRATTWKFFSRAVTHSRKNVALGSEGLEGVSGGGAPKPLEPGEHACPGRRSSAG